MIPFDLAKRTVETASDFEGQHSRLLMIWGLDVEDLKQRAAHYSSVSGVGPVEALHRLAVAVKDAALAAAEGEET